MKEIGSRMVFSILMVWLVVISASVFVEGPEGGIVGHAADYESVEEIDNIQEFKISLIQGEQFLQIDLENYLVGVLLAEMPADFHQQAKRAQAVAARTFALKMKDQTYRHGGKGICDDAGCCQGYISASQYLSNGGTLSAVQEARAAVDATKGNVLTYGGQLIDATYFSCSGGRTEDAIAVWGTEIPYLQAVDSPGEEYAKWYRDVQIFSKEEFEVKLGRKIEGEPQMWFGKPEYTDGGGVKSITIGGTQYSGTVLRTMLGLRSSSFQISVLNDEIIIQTKGFGHRVGLSQYGADAMARNGSSWRQILLHYYQGVNISQQLDSSTD